MSRRSAIESLENIAAPMVEADPRLTRSRELLRRFDHKFVIDRGSAFALLEEVREHYAVLMAGNARVARYRTLYFDTDDLRFYHDHRRGRRPRYKIRIRHYDDRALSFLEIKVKRSISQTTKRRLAIEFECDAIPEQARDFVAQHSPVPVSALRPRAWTNFRRLGLVSLEHMERVTVDIELSSNIDGQTRQVPELALVEVKQSPPSTRTPIMRALRRAGIRATPASKYVWAIASGVEGVRTARLKPLLERIAEPAVTREVQGGPPC